MLSQVGRLAANNGISATTNPSLTDIDSFLTDRATQIDAALASRGLAVPIVNSTPANPTLTAFLAELARLNAEGAAADAMLAAYITNDSNDRGTGAIKLKSFEATIGRLQAGRGIPVGLSVAEPDLAPRSYFTDAGAIGGSGVSSGEFGDWTNGTYTSGQDQFGQPVSAKPIFTIGAQY